MALNKEHLSLTHVRLIGVPKSPGYYMADPGEEGDATGQLGITRSLVVYG
jgi:hypothetical protein